MFMAAGQLVCVQKARIIHVQHSTRVYSKGLNSTEIGWPGSAVTIWSSGRLRIHRKHTFCLFSLLYLTPRLVCVVSLCFNNHFYRSVWHPRDWEVSRWK